LGRDLWSPAGELPVKFLSDLGHFENITPSLLQSKGMSAT
jgi:hypothetical protein